MALPIGATTTHAATGASLVVQYGRSSQHWHLGDQPMTIGRRPENDIVLTSLFVSGNHARIDPVGAAHRIVDLGSTNGLLFGGQYVTEQRLKHGDVIRIGDAETGDFVTLTYQNTATMQTEDQRLSQQQFPLRSDQQQVLIGRAQADITLPSPQVSRRHAQITRTGDRQHTLEDLGSTNGTYVNGKRITQHALTVGDVINIGSFKLVYRGTSLDTYDQQGELHIDALNLVLRVGSGASEKLLLKHISLSIAPREFVAIVGGSGAGKSTLLKALSGFVPAGEGTVQMNGDDFYANFNVYRTTLGYLPQDDIIHRLLPVDRALGYAANLRLSADMNRQEIDQRIAQALERVEMTPHRAKMVRQLSGGQRKRTSMAVELLAEPSLLFLDEATSGLDPNLEKKTMYMLRRLADSGRTVLLVTHATENILQCDHVAFMASGHLVFFGPPQEALRFFQIDSGDFADIYTKLEGHATPDSPLIQRELRAAYERWQQANPRATAPPLLAHLWEDTYRHLGDNGAPPLYQRYVADRQRPPAAATTQAADHDKPTVSALRQYLVLTRRYVDLLLRDRVNLLILMLQVPIIALVLILISDSNVLLSWTSGISEVNLVQRNEAKTVLFMVAIASIWLGIFNAAREIAKEIPIFVRERLSGLNIGAYLLSKMTVLSGLALVQSIILVLILVVGLQFPDDTGVLLPSFVVGEVFVSVLLGALASTALGLLISALVGKPGRVLSIVPLILILQIVFAGLIFQIDGAATVVSWLTVSRWSLDALGTSTHVLELCPTPNLADSAGRFIAPCTRQGAAQEPDAFLPNAFVHEPGHLLLVWGVLLAQMGVYLGLTAWYLKRHQWRF